VVLPVKIHQNQALCAACRVYTYAEVLASASPSLQKELTPDVWPVRYDACQKGIAQVGATLAAVAPDVLVMIGDDQKELFQRIFPSNPKR
jgi:hypothetical protein